jgi:hypothetical protein
MQLRYRLGFVVQSSNDSERVHRASAACVANCVPYSYVTISATRFTVLLFVGQGHATRYQSKPPRRASTITNQSSRHSRFLLQSSSGLYGRHSNHSDSNELRSSYCTHPGYSAALLERTNPDSHDVFRYSPALRMHR